MTCTDDQKKKGWDAEKALREMLDREGIAHLPFCDNFDKYSEALKNFFGSKRPDMMILFRYIGFIFVEVKHKKIYEKYNTFLIDAEEAEKYERFREAFGHEIWYAISNTENNFKKWYWLPAHIAVKDYEIISTKDGPCISVPVSDFIQVESFTEFAQFLLNAKQG